MTTGWPVALILYLLLFIGAEALYHHGFQARVTRKIVHIGGGMISALLPLLVSLPTALVLGLFFRLF